MQLVERPTVDRISLVRVEHIQQVTHTFIEVELLNGQQRIQAHAPVQDDPSLAASSATVQALNSLFAPHAPLHLVGVQTSTFGTRDVVTAYVTHHHSAHNHMLGTTLIRQSVAEAAVRAVLAATNRQLAGWLSERERQDANPRLVPA